MQKCSSIVIVPALLSLMLSCTSTTISQPTLAQSGTNDNADAIAIKRLLNQIATADSAGDLDGIVSLYSDDAILLPPDRPILRGIDTIRQHYQKLFGHYKLEVTVHAQEIGIAGDWAHSLGTTTVRSFPRTGSQITQSIDKYIMLLKRAQDGNWKIHRLMWSPQLDRQPA